MAEKLIVQGRGDKEIEVRQKAIVASAARDSIASVIDALEEDWRGMNAQGQRDLIREALLLLLQEREGAIAVATHDKQVRRRNRTR